MTLRDINVIRLRPLFWRQNKMVMLLATLLHDLLDSHRTVLQQEALDKDLRLLRQPARFVGMSPRNTSVGDKSPVGERSSS